MSDRNFAKPEDEKKQVCVREPLSGQEEGVLEPFGKQRLVLRKVFREKGVFRRPLRVGTR
jgi:hypothetical protein